MEPTSFEEILREINGYTDHISLHVLGEALLHPHLEHFLFLSQEYGVRVNLSTNGVLLARNREMLLRQPALRQINISLHSFEQSESESALGSYLAGIFAFIAAAAAVASPLFINLRMWNMVEGGDHVSVGISSLIFQRLENHFGLATPLSSLAITERGLTIAPRLFISRERRFTWPHATATELGAHGYCRGLRDHIAILVDGTVVPCCLDAEGDIPLGNIFQATLGEILAGSRAALLREGFTRQRLLDPMCRRCTYRLRFQSHSPVKPFSGGFKLAV